MRFAFRADASLQIGSGHVMRCLTLAESLRETGAECLFLCREHPGHLFEVIHARGFNLIQMPSGVSGDETSHGGEKMPTHYSWLGCDWQTDVRICTEAFATFEPDWLIVDHYSVDYRWEKALRPYCRQIMVIDDLADRPHACELLLDQNLGRKTRDYQGLVSAECRLMIGPRYALLRPEFGRLREYSLSRRVTADLRTILITMGGVDNGNATGRVLEALKECPFPQHCRISVVMGPTAPWLEQVRQQAAQMPFPTEVLVNVSDMAQRMADADLGIGAAGSTSWERCCLGLPTLMGVLAENQKEIADALNQSGAAISLGSPFEGTFKKRIIDQVVTLISDHEKLKIMSFSAAEVTDGSGCQFVSSKVLEYGNHHPL